MVEHFDIIAILVTECLGVACFVGLGATGFWATSLATMLRRKG